ncbi:hypothetical protein RJ640_019738 [Escallonia rubra]|uniref:SMP domain-containing protein n=1 Tax=Escallonia rubra TaxID=112253 RepID=A0AA88U7Q2_9ASTE|nr:hypothetical protein RJ640_019738 [Escallonia rubra]
MSQGQPQRPQGDPEPIKYGDVFVVSGELASQPIAPQDAAAMQAAENIVLGETQKGGPAAVMQSAAAVNERRGVVGHDDATGVARDQGITISEAEVAGHRIITEAVGGQVVGQYVRPALANMNSPAAVLGGDAITIGEALEATALSAGDKPVDQSDAAAIQAAEVRAARTSRITPGGLASSAQAAATLNARTMLDENKTKLADVLADATTKLPDDKPVTREDAEGVIGAELRNNPDLATHPGGVASSMAAAARLNQEK